MKTPWKTCVLGESGMLGQMVGKYFGHTRSGFMHIDAYRIDVQRLTDQIHNEKPDVIINCIGAIPQKVQDSATMVFLNTEFPLQLRRLLKPEVLLVHPSTDCVEEETAYGRSKLAADLGLLALNTNTIIIRTSVIGPWGPHGLFEKVLNHQVPKGYTNHFWNGITTLEWCRVVEQLITFREDHAARLITVASNQPYAQTKYHLIKAIEEIYLGKSLVEPVEHKSIVDRLIRNPTMLRKDIESQLFDLKVFTSNS